MTIPGDTVEFFLDNDRHLNVLEQSDHEEVVLENVIAKDIAWRRSVRATDGVLYYQLYVKLKAREWKPFGESASYIGPIKVSPSGESAVVSILEHGEQDYGIWSLDLKEPTLTFIDWALDADWSNDQTLVFARKRQGIDLFSQKKDGSEYQYLGALQNGQNVRIWYDRYRKNVIVNTFKVFRDRAYAGVYVLNTNDAQWVVLTPAEGYRDGVQLFAETKEITYRTVENGQWKVLKRTY
ncbi:MAG: hypothetical protein MK193_05590 [Lentisphaeria bacterium]|nr:hypothetical protein [Lentisphaeria bacterium]